MLREGLAVAATAVLLVASGCAKSSTGVSVAVTGTWSGVGSQNGVSFSIGVAITEAGDGTITGAGTLIASSNTLSVDVSGRRTGSSVTLAFNHTGFVTATFTGQLDTAADMQGDVNGSGFTNMRMNLVKH